jgi:hypothetical protein
MRKKKKKENINIYIYIVLLMRQKTALPTSRALLDCVKIFFFAFVFFTGRERALDSTDL